MAIVIDTTFGTYEMVFADLLEIARCDPGLSTQMQLAGRFLVNFTQKQSSNTSSNRLLALAGHAQPVVVKGVPGDYTLQTGEQITDHAGMTFIPPETPTVSIEYDVSDAGGLHYWVLDAKGNSIHMPRPVLLYHELSHAYHAITGDLPSDEALAEVQAMKDENDFRGQLKLPLRHSSNHTGGTGAPAVGGVASVPCKAEYTGWSPGWKCAVATAAMGSPHEPRVAELRRARREYRRLSWWAALAAQPALDLYAQFGQRVAREMLHDRQLRESMLWYAVVPACHLLQLAEAHLAADDDTPDLLHTFEHSLSGYITALRESGRSAMNLVELADDASNASRWLASGGPVPELRGGEAQQHRTVFGRLAREIASTPGTAAAFVWGLEGLSHFLRAAAGHAAGAPDTSAALAGAVGGWTARPPLPATIPFDVHHARQELRVLGDRVFTRTDSRARFAEHLLSNWPNRTAGSLDALLRELGYLPPAAQA